MILLVSYVIGIIYFIPVFLPLGIQTVDNTTLSSNTTGNNEETGFLNGFWNDIFTVISAIGSAATAIALYVVWTQARLAQKEVTTTLRPWISASKVKYVKPEKVEVRLEYFGKVEVRLKNYGRVELTLKNHGRLPAKVFNPNKYMIDNNDEIKAKDLKQLGKGEKDYIFLLSPDAEKIHNIKLDQHDLKIITVKPWFLGFVLYYSYADNQEGEYGMILKWQDESEEPEIMNEFADGMEESKGLKEKLAALKEKLAKVKLVGR